MPCSTATDQLSDMSHHKRRVGGVVTQRIANPCTPVRFRYSPPFNFKHLTISSRGTIEGVCSSVYGFFFAAPLAMLKWVEHFPALNMRNSRIDLINGGCTAPRPSHMICDLVQAQARSQEPRGCLPHCDKAPGQWGSNWVSETRSNARLGLRGTQSSMGRMGKIEFPKMCFD